MAWLSVHLGPRLTGSLTEIDANLFPLPSPEGWMLVTPAMLESVLIF